MKQSTYDIIKQLIGIHYWDINLNNGIVKPKNTKRVPTKLKDQDEYDAIRVNYAGKQMRFYVHNIIAVAGGLNPVDKHITHLNDDIHDNRLANLRVVENLETIMKLAKIDRKRVDNGLRCEKHPRAKLKNKDVAYIRYRLENGTRGIYLAELYKVSHRVISCIKMKTTWVQITAMSVDEAMEYESSERGKELGLNI